MYILVYVRNNLVNNTAAQENFGLASPAIEHNEFNRVKKIHLKFFMKINEKKCFYFPFGFKLILYFLRMFFASKFNFEQVLEIVIF